MEGARIYRMPPCRMVSSGSAMFGDGVLEAFDEWFSSFPREMYPKDFLWFDGQGFVWYYIYEDGMDVPERFEIVDFSGGLYAVVTGRDGDDESYAAAIAELEAFLAASGFERDSDRAQLGSIITPPEAVAALGYEQMDHYVPIKLK